MNPATDVGKKDLPASLRSRFTELYVPSPDADRDALTAIVEKYIGEHALGDRGAIMDVAECYAEIRRLAQQHNWQTAPTNARTSPFEPCPRA